MLLNAPIYNEKINIPSHPSAQVYIKRIDKIHQKISGNKYYKLKYNIEVAKDRNYKGLLTFGGASSNHIAAVACLGVIEGLPTVGIIRGEELSKAQYISPTLQYVRVCGMELKFVSRETYSAYTQGDFFDKSSDFEDWYLLPEGGTNDLAVKGCEEILTNEDLDFDVICCPVGTGGTIAGLSNSSADYQRIIGFSALKGNFLPEQIKRWTEKKNWEIIPDDAFGGYAKITDELISFINNFFEATKIPLDPVYTGKMMFKIFELYKKGYFCSSDKMLVIHTGGLQGILATNNFLKSKNRKTIHFYE